MLIFDVLRFHPRLSFLRKDDPDDGVDGSSGSDICTGVSVFVGLPDFWALGPVSLAGLAGSRPLSMPETSPLVFARGMKECSPPFFGKEEDIKGDTVCLGCRLFTGIGLL